MSSAYCKCVNFTLSSPTLNPKISPFEAASLITKVKALNIKLKRKEDMWSPYLSPLCVLKGSVGDPLTITDMVTFVIDHIFHPIIFSPKPICVSMCSKKDHLIESYAFLKSILNRAPGFFFLLSQEIAKLVVIRQSEIHLPSINPD